MRNRIFAACMCIIAAAGACSEYELEKIKPTLTPGPIYFPDLPDNRRLPPSKDPALPDGPLDLGDPKIPDIELSFFQYDFGTRELADPPVNAYLEIQNVGDYPLRISAINQSNTSNSFVVAPLPNMEIMPAGKEILIISYAPTIHGPDGASLQIYSNDPDESSMNVYIIGRGATPELDVQPKKVDFGAIEVTESPTEFVDFENVGDGILNITNIFKTQSNPDINIVSLPGFVLTPGQKTSMEVSYSPSGIGSDIETFNIASNDPANPLQSVTVNGTTKEPNIDAPVALDFGMLDVGSSSTKGVLIKNTGTATLKVTGIYFANNSPVFSLVQSFTGDILPGDSEQIEIKYAPDDYIPDAGTIEIMSNDVDEPVHAVILSGDVGIPEISVSPVNLDFGKVMVNGASAAEKIKISNIGTGQLDIFSIALKGGLPFSWTPLGKNTIDPGFSVNLDVAYTPPAYAPNSDELSILSNDPQNTSVLIPLNGWGSAPQLEIYPDPYDFGAEYLGCDIEKTIDIKNVGDMDLEVTNIEFFTSFPSHFSVDYDLVTNGQFPWTISASSQCSVYIEYLPMNIAVDSAFLKVHSDDPQSAVTLSDQYGSGIYYSSVMDTFTQSNVLMSDILFVIDNSCSMGSWQTHVATNFDSFITVFENSGVDYHIATITTDNPTFVGNIIDSNTIDPILEFNIQAQVGTYGSGMERGLDMAYESLQPGGDAAPGSVFERADAKMSLIFVSDEPDYSYELATALDYSTYFKGVKSNSSKIVAHAVCGDCPGNCTMAYTTSTGATYSKWASCNMDYIDVVSDMGGTQLSLCDADWGLKMETLAKHSIVKSSFELSDIPIQKTIDVLVDGILTGNWTFDPLINSVIFDPGSIPAAGSLVDINYYILGGC